MAPPRSDTPDQALDGHPTRQAVAERAADLLPEEAVAEDPQALADAVLAEYEERTAKRATAADPITEVPAD